MSGDQLCRLKEPEKENKRLRRAVSDLTLDKQILKEAAGGNFQALASPPVHRSCLRPSRGLGAPGLPGAGAAPLDPAPHPLRA